MIRWLTLVVVIWLGVTPNAMAGYYKSTTCTNSGNDYDVWPENTPTSYVDLDVIVFTASATNTGAAYLQFHGTGALGYREIRKCGSIISLFPGDIQPGQTVLCVYDSTNSVFQLINEQAGYKLGNGAVTYTSAGSGTFNWPDGVQKVFVKCWSGGGAGGGSQDGAILGGAGAGGGCAYGWITRPASGQTNYTVGAGGASVPANSTSNGGTGGQTWFGSTLGTIGASGGLGSAHNGGEGGSGGTPAGTDWLSPDHSGAMGQATSAVVYCFCLGGVCGGGMGAADIANSGGGPGGSCLLNGYQPGGGGSGGFSGAASGAGGVGLIEVYW